MPNQKQSEAVLVITKGLDHFQRHLEAMDNPVALLLVTAGMRALGVDKEHPLRKSMKRLSLTQDLMLAELTEVYASLARALNSGDLDAELEKEYQDLQEATAGIRKEYAEATA